MRPLSATALGIRQGRRILEGGHHTRPAPSANQRARTVHERRSARTERRTRERVAAVVVVVVVVNTKRDRVDLSVLVCARLSECEKGQVPTGGSNSTARTDTYDPGKGCAGALREKCLVVVTIFV